MTEVTDNRTTAHGSPPDAHAARRRRTRIALVAFASAFPVLTAGPVFAVAEADARVEPGTQIAVIAITVALLIAAFFAARSARRNPRSGEMPIDERLLDVELLEAEPGSSREAPVVSTFETVFLLLLAGYAFFDRGFAWFHVPGTPLFVGELTLAFGVLAMMSTRAPILASLRLSPAFKVLAAWMGWGLLFLGLQVPTYGLDAIRDSAIWYYGAVSVLVLFLLLSDPGRFGRWSGLFLKAMPFLLLWYPFAMAGDALFGESPPYVPDSQVPLFSHRFGNIAVASAMILGFIWLVDRHWGRLSSTQRVTYSALAAMMILIVGFQNRGGMVSATIGIIVMLVFMRGRRAELVLAVGTVIVGLAAIAVITDVSIPISNSREISAAQMMDNIGSIIDPDSGEARQRNTTQWRLELWTAVLDDVVTEHPISGFGPGPDLGERYGVSTNEDVPLRNPHNSHLGVMSRMGMVGFGLWVVLWITWAFQLLMLRTRLLGRGREAEAGLAAWLVVSALTILLNSVFDPTLEGPQVGFWLWTVFGIGIALPVVYSGIAGDRWALPRTAPPPEVATTGPTGR